MIAVILLPLFSLAVSGCGQDAAVTEDQVIENNVAAAENEAESVAVTVTDAYIRGLPPGQTVTAAFMTLKNNTDKDCQLVGAESPIVSGAEVHAHFHKDGRMSMRPMDALDVPANESVSLKPGGYHLMLFGLENPLKDGEMQELTLMFKGCPEIKMTVPVQSVLHENHH